MARQINISTDLHVEPRFQKLVIKLGSSSSAYGALVQLWMMAQRYWFPKKLPIPGDKFLELDHYQALLDLNWAYKTDGGYYTRGAADYFQWIFDRQAGGKKGGGSNKINKLDNKKTKKQLKATESNSEQLNATCSNIQQPTSTSTSTSTSTVPVPSTSTITSTVFKSTGEADKSTIPGNPQSSESIAVIKNTAREVWNRYSNAYHNKYGTYPVRNAKVNTIILNFCRRLETKEAPFVAEFFLSHNDYWYVKALHPVDLLLRDAEKLRTEWKTGVKSTEKEARLSDKEQQFESQLARIQRGEL